MAPSLLKRLLPGLQTLAGYRKQDLAPDMLAGLVVCLVLVPSALAYAELAGFGPLAGIYSAIAATLAYFQIRRGTHRSTQQLEKAIRNYLETYNENPEPFNWTKTADEIFAGIQRFCMRISDSAH